MKTLVYIEFEDEARECLKSVGENGLREKEVLLVSPNPKVRLFLGSRNISCKPTLEYFGNGSQTTIIEKTESIIQRMLSAVSFRDGSGLTEAYRSFFVYHLKFYLNYFFMNLEILNNICSKHKIERVVAFSRSGFFASKAFIDDGERWLGVLVERFCAQRGMCAATLKAVVARKKFLSLASDYLVKIAAQIYFRVYFFIVKPALRRLKSSVVIPTWGYKFDGLVREIQRRNPLCKSILIVKESEGWKRTVRLLLMSFAVRIPFLKEDKFSDYVIPTDLVFRADRQEEVKSFGAEFDCVKHLIDRSLRSELFFHGVDISDVLSKKLMVGLRSEMQRLGSDLSQLKRLFEEIKPSLVLSPFSMGFYYGMGEISKMLKISSCVISHGTHVPPANRYEEIENYWLARGVVLNDYLTVAVQTPWAEKFLDFYADKRERLYTGPLIFARGKELDRKGGGQSVCKKGIEKVILYATTQRTRFANRFYIAETIDEFIQSLSDIVEVISDVEGVKLVIRPHPACELSDLELKKSLPPSTKYTIVSQGRFEDILSDSDLLVSYSSTCIEEALNNDIPVVLYDRWRRYNHFGVPETEESFDIGREAVWYITRKEILKRFVTEFALQKPCLTDGRAFSNYKYDIAWNEKFYQYVSRCVSGGVER